MAKPDKKKQQKGIRGGLQTVFAFLPAFLLLGYGIPLSIFFAITGGCSVGMILAWWQSDEPAKAKRNPLRKFKKLRPRKQYPGLRDIGGRASSQGDLKKEKPPRNNFLEG